MPQDFRTVWANCLRVIRAEVGEQSFSTWFMPIVPVELQGNVLTIQVPSVYFYEYLEEQYVEELKRAIYQELGPEGRLEYRRDSGPGQRPGLGQNHAPAAGPQNGPQPGSAARRAAPAPTTARLPAACSPAAPPRPPATWCPVPSSPPPPR